MKHARIAALLIGCIVTTAAEAQQLLELANGDRLTGTLTKVSGGVWSFSHGSGDLEIPAAQIAAFVASAPIGIRLVDGTILAATVSATAGGLQLTAPDGSQRTVSTGDVAAIGDPIDLDALVPVRVGYFTPLARFWGATAGLGFSDKSGNSRSRGLTADLEVARRSPKDRLTFKLGVVREQNPDMVTGDLTTTVEKYYGSVRAGVFFGSSLFAFASTQQERDQFQDIDLRSNYNAGVGVQVLSTNRTDLRFSASGGLRRESFTSGGAESTPIAGAGAEVRQALGAAALSWAVNFTPSVKAFEDFRLVSEASITTTVFSGLGFRIAARNEVNNRPQPGIEKHDMLLTTALTYSIGN